MNASFGLITTSGHHVKHQCGAKPNGGKKHESHVAHVFPVSTMRSFPRDIMTENDGQSPAQSPKDTKRFGSPAPLFKVVSQLSALLMGSLVVAEQNEGEQAVRVVFALICSERTRKKKRKKRIRSRGRIMTCRAAWTIFVPQIQRGEHTHICAYSDVKV